MSCNEQDHLDEMKCPFIDPEMMPSQRFDLVKAGPITEE
jgi:hypothetical protein